MPLWCKCYEHGPLVNNFIAAIQALETHSKQEEASGCPDWVRIEHRQLREQAQALLKNLVRHFQREQMSP